MVSAEWQSKLHSDFVNLISSIFFRPSLLILTGTPIHTSDSPYSPSNITEAGMEISSLLMIDLITSTVFFAIPKKEGPFSSLISFQ